ncbi:hypothetical protein WDL1CHR_02937 [Variovorax sp. WDL1]|nr:hypothetical protein CHC07_00109 [Variovorax sp. B4]PNG61825.1 hypothetical protein CHC06_01727 [Variovorax sp. B2]VTV12112.1 hypothetical protein WDL1CHR_02937 [Variovorax sp. WDL1]
MNLSQSFPSVAHMLENMIGDDQVEALISHSNLGEIQLGNACMCRVSVGQNVLRRLAGCNQRDDMLLWRKMQDPGARDTFGKPYCI